MNSRNISSNPNNILTSTPGTPLPEIPGKPESSREPKGYLFLTHGMKKGGRFVVWLRRTHAWLGLWGAAMGLIFGVSGILLNHRAEMKIPLAEQKEEKNQIKLADECLQSPQQMESCLRSKYGMADAKSRIQKKPSEPAPWGNGLVIQPEQWNVTLTASNRSVSAQYWQGNGKVRIEERKANFWALLNNLHRGTGMSNAWILLTDTLAGGLFVLAITGTLLWSRLHGPRLLALGLIGTTLSAILGMVFTTLSLH